jgi:ApaG protein
MAGAPEHGQRRVLHIARICFRSAAQEKAAAARADHVLRVAAIVTQPHARVGLPGRGPIGHHDGMFTSEATTRGIRVSVVSEYSSDRSRPQHSEWFFLYTITIANESAETVQLLSRHWIITNGAGEVEEVRGPGVIGEQPVLAPNESFTYTSGCPLKTAFGKMEGTYQMTTKGGERFDVRIAPFTLSEPYTVH